MEKDPITEAAVEEHDSSERWTAAISYLAIVCWIPYFLFSDRPFILYHAKQGVLLFLAELVGAILLWILDVTIGRIPFLGLLLIILIQLGFFLLVLALSVLGFSRALAGEQLPLPWLGHLAEELPDPPWQPRR